MLNPTSDIAHSGTGIDYPVSHESIYRSLSFAVPRCAAPRADPRPAHPPGHRPPKDRPPARRAWLSAWHPAHVAFRVSSSAQIRSATCPTVGCRSDVGLQPLGSRSTNAPPGVGELRAASSNVPPGSSSPLPLSPAGMSALTATRPAAGTGPTLGEAEGVAPAGSHANWRACPVSWCGRTRWPGRSTARRRYGRVVLPCVLPSKAGTHERDGVSARSLADRAGGGTAVLLARRPRRLAHDVPGSTAWKPGPTE
jgi:hypothetical protein